MSYSATLVPTAKVDRSIPTNIVVFIAPPAAVSVLRAVLATVPREFPAAIVFLHHAGEGRERPIAENLNVSPRLLVAPGMVGMPLLNGRGYVLRSDSSLTVGSAGTFVEDKSSTDDRCETILESIAHQWGAGVIAITLTALSREKARRSGKCARLAVTRSRLTKRTAFGPIRPDLASFPIQKTNCSPPISSGSESSPCFRRRRRCR